MGKVSVIVPLYNVGKYVVDCVTSILIQTYSDFELILVDDGSTDSTGRLCDELAEKDSRVVVIHKPNGGVGSARNAGIEKATGEYLCFVDGDDFLSKDSLEAMVSSIEENSADLFIGEVIMTDEEGKKLEEKTEIHDDVVINEYEFWTRRNKKAKYVIAMTKLYPRRIFENVHFGKYVNHEDQGILWELLSQCNRIVDSDKVVCFYRQREGSASHTEFSLNHLALSEVLISEMRYFQSKGWYDLMMYSWGMGTRNIAEGYKFLNTKDRENKRFLEERSREYLSYARILLGKVKSIKEKTRLFMYMFSPRIYFLVKDRIG